ncbi:hypothetical protein GQ53DRAFT_750455 [Thozetella sp. PMI_491]|nr:hypothetical protein GQ53DRAFT_750455 [Thozetella sp. PMI_491]
MNHLAGRVCTLGRHHCTRPYHHLRRDRFALPCCRPAVRIARFRPVNKLDRSLISKERISKQRSSRQRRRQLQRMVESKKYVSLCLAMLHPCGPIPRADLQLPPACLFPATVPHLSSPLLQWLYYERWTPVCEFLLLLEILPVY